MKSLSIHNLDPDLAKAIEQMALQTGLSQNKVIKVLLRRALGLAKSPKSGTDFSAYCGLWTAEEAFAFDKNTSVFDQIEENLWQ